MKLVYICFFLTLTGNAFGQAAPVDFEAGGHGATWTWTSFENDTNPAVEIIANPSASGLNTSATVASLTTLTTGQPWAGCESQHGTDIGTFSINATNSTIKMMVYKPVVSDVGIKLVKPDGWSMGEIKVANTVINEWEELTFDFTSQISDGYDQIVIFPDFDLGGRTTDNTCYFDNITFSAGGGGSPGGSPEVAAPTPELDPGAVRSVFSDSYPVIDGVNLNPGWGQATVVTEVSIEGNNTLLYTGLNYQGTQFTAQDVSGMDYMHVDYWTDNATELKFFVISQTPTVDSDFHSFDLVSEEWVSVDIPLTTYPNVDLTDVFQFKVEGNGTIYWDNLFFHSDVVGIHDHKEVAPQAFALEQNFPNPFNPSTSIGFSLEQSSQVTLQVYNVAGQEVIRLLDSQLQSGQHTVQFNAKDLAAGTYFYVLTVGQLREVKKLVLIK